MNIVLGCTLLIACTLIGKYSTLKYKKRVDFFEEFIRFNNVLKRNLLFKRENILKLLDYNTKNQEFSATLKSVKLKICGISRDRIYIPEFIEESDFFTSYFDCLGLDCSVGELDLLNEYEVISNEKLLKIKDNCSKFSKLGSKLGFSAGMVVMILLL